MSLTDFDSVVASLSPVGVVSGLTSPSFFGALFSGKSDLTVAVVFNATTLHEGVLFEAGGSFVGWCVYTDSDGTVRGFNNTTTYTGSADPFAVDLEASDQYVPTQDFCGVFRCSPSGAAAASLSGLSYSANVRGANASGTNLGSWCGLPTHLTNDTATRNRFIREGAVVEGLVLRGAAWTTSLSDSQMQSIVSAFYSSSQTRRTFRPEGFQAEILIAGGFTA